MDSGPGHHVFRNIFDLLPESSVAKVKRAEIAEGDHHDEIWDIVKSSTMNTALPCVKCKGTLPRPCWNAKSA